MKIKNLKFYAQIAVIAGGIVFINNNMNRQIEELKSYYSAEMEPLKQKNEEQNRRLESLEQRIDALTESQKEDQDMIAKLIQKDNQIEANTEKVDIEQIEESSKEVVTQLVIALQEDGAYGLHFYKEGNKPADYITTKNIEKELRSIKDTHKDNIQIVYFDGCKDAKTLDALSHFENLRRVSIEDCEFSDLTKVGAHQNLEFLRIVNCNNLENIKPLGNLTNLKNFILNNTQVEDVSPLATLHSLETLDLRTNQITDPSSLANLTNLYSICLEGNNISDHTTLHGFIEKDLIDEENINQIASAQNNIRK